MDGSHSDTFEDVAGNQYLLLSLESQTPCNYGLYSVQLGAGAKNGLPVELGGGTRRIMPLFRCGSTDKWLDFHIGCAKSSPFCAVSITTELYNEVRDPTDKSPLRRTPYMGEIMIMRDNGAEIRRIAMHRSMRFSNEEARGYWSTTRAAISPDGSWVVADSNFGLPNQPRVISMETGFGVPAIQSINGVVNLATQEQRFAPGIPAVVQGTNLAACREAGTPPLPTEICGTRVLVEDTAAKLISVSPERIQFLWPDAKSGDTPLTLRVTRGTDTSRSATTTVKRETVQEKAPSIFTTFVDTTPWAIVQVALPEGQKPEENRPMHLGETGTIYATGLGQTNPAVADGEAAPATEPLARLDPLPELYINNTRQPVSFAGLVPGLISIFQINFTLDPSTPVMENNEIWLFANSAESLRRAIRIAP